MRKLSGILLLLLFAGEPGAAQRALPPTEVKIIRHFEPPAPVFFEHITRQEGLPAGRSIPLLRDSRGYLWLFHVSLGLLRYDGYRFEEFRDTADHILDGRVFSYILIEDQEGNLWMTSPTGLKRLNPATRAFTTFLNTAGKSNEITCVFIDRQQRLWVNASGEGLFQVDRFTGVFTQGPSTKVYDGFSGLETDWEVPIDINIIQGDRDGVLWISASSADHHQGLYSYDPARLKWSFFPFYWKMLEGTNNAALGIYWLWVDNDNRYIWLGTYNGVGLLRLDKQQRRWKQYLFQTAAGAHLPENSIVTIYPKQNGQLWLGSDYKNFVFDIARETVSRYEHRPDDPSSLPKIPGNCVLSDQEGIYWFCMDEPSVSLTKTVPGHQFFLNPEQLTGLKYVFGIWKNPATDDVFYGINKINKSIEPVIVKINGKDGKTTVRPCPEIPERLSGSNTIYALHGDPSSAFVWVLTASGLFRLNPQTLKLTAVGAKIPNHQGWTTDSLNLYRIDIDPDGKIWLCIRAGGLLKEEARSEQFYLFPTLKDSPNGLMYERLRTIYCDRKGRVWIGYWVNSGISRFDPATGTFTHFKESPGDSTALQAGIVFGFAETADGRIWVSYQNGFSFIDTDDKVHQVPTVAWLDPRRVVADKQDNLWITTHTNKLLRYTPKTEDLQVFDYRNGFVPNDFADGLYVADDGEIFFSDQYRWRPETLRRDSTPFHVVFSRFRIFEKDAFFGRDLNYLDQVTLRHDQNFFSISFAALAFANPAKNTYAYRLDGLEADWVQAGTRHEASYTNLAPGRYTFWVKAANEDGVWASAPIALHIQILPAWWQTIWFKILVALAAGALIAAFYRQHLARVRAKAEAKQKVAELQQLQAEFRQRLAETEMAALRAQMNPHFLFNVMNSINRFLLENDAEEASVYLTKFSRLIRLVLENSRSEKVTLENELEALRLYIEMETLRFKGKVRYEMHIQPDIDLKFTRIPPLLLQPYVENAIWHGLLHKDEGGAVTISVEQPEENVLHVEITDDGIGRTAAAALHSKSAQRHKSFGMQVTKERIELINELYRTQTQIEIRDLSYPDGSAAGTQVTLDIPV